MTHNFLIRFNDKTSTLFTNAKMYVVDDENRMISIVSEEKSQLIFFDDVSSIEIVKAEKTVIYGAHKTVEEIK